MKPQKIRRLKALFLFIFLSLSVWGCAHGQKAGHGFSADAAPVRDKADAPGPDNTAADVEDPLFDGIPDGPAPDTAETPFPVDDPLFDDIPDDAPQTAGTDDEVYDPLFDDDPLFDAPDDDSLFDGGVADLTPETLVWDPLMPVNRVMFTFNDKVYFWALKPVVRGYKAVTPEFFRVGLRNAFRNIAMPVRLVSSILQLRPKQAGKELTRFVVNTTVGVAGLWDPADRWLGLKFQREDFGQAMGYHGIGNGFYIVLPFLGPSTLRDGVGLAGDMFLHPLYYVDNTELAIGLGALDLFNRTSFILGDYETLKRASMDPYVMTRDFYISYRNRQIAE